MEKQREMSGDYYTIDLLYILKFSLKRLWLIILTGILGATVGFSVAAFAIAPTYSSSVMLYVNNSSFSLGSTSFSISSSEISAAQSLVKTYSEILKNRTTLESVIDKAGLTYKYTELYDMISAAPSNNTEIMKVTVTSEDPYEAAKIANCIAEILPTRVSEVIDGASMEIVDSAIPNHQKVGPSITKYTALGLFLGVVVAVAILAIMAITDDTIHDEDYILQTYDYPILAKIPDLLADNSKQRGYYRADNKSKS